MQLPPGSGRVGEVAQGSGVSVGGFQLGHVRGSELLGGIDTLASYPDDERGTKRGTTRSWGSRVLFKDKRSIRARGAKVVEKRHSGSIPVPRNIDGIYLDVVDGEVRNTGVQLHERWMARDSLLAKHQYELRQASCTRRGLSMPNACLHRRNMERIVGCSPNREDGADRF